MLQFKWMNESSIEKTGGCWKIAALPKSDFFATILRLKVLQVLFCGFYIWKRFMQRSRLHLRFPQPLHAAHSF